MVCKEDILLWFKESASYKRIDVIYNLLNMCVPFELRFVGTVVEDIGKRTYQELRGAELKANDPSELATEATASPGLRDGAFRRKITLYLSLLHTYNRACARGIFDILTGPDVSETAANGGVFARGDGNALEELLLLYTMAINHPAFTFEQQTRLGKILVRLLEEEKVIHPQPTPYQLPMQRVPIVLPKSYVLVKNPMQEDMPAPVPMAGPPPGIPMAPPLREPIMTSVAWGAPPDPPSPHLMQHQESPVQSRTASPVNPGPNLQPARSHSTRRPPFQSRQEIQVRKTIPCSEDKDIDASAPWRNTRNGLRPGVRAGLPSVQCCPQQHAFCTAQLEALSLDPDASRHCSSSSESGRSSASHSPPGTPLAPGRRRPDGGTAPGRSVRSNGRPPPQCPDPVVVQQQQQPAYTQSGAPYAAAPYTLPAATTYPRLTYGPAQSYRPPFAYQPNGELVYSYPTQFVPVVAYPAPPPKPSCYNCGAAGHTGHECSEPSIEEITRPGNYRLDFATPSPDCAADK